MGGAGRLIIREHVAACAAVTLKNDREMLAGLDKFHEICGLSNIMIILNILRNGG
jgi:hypothetical protein